MITQETLNYFKIKFNTVKIKFVVCIFRSYCSLFHTYNGNVFAALVFHNQGEESKARYRRQLHFGQYEVNVMGFCLEYLPCL